MVYSGFAKAIHRYFHSGRAELTLRHDSSCRFAVRPYHTRNIPEMSDCPVCAVTGAMGYIGSRITAALLPEANVVPIGRSVGPTGILWQMGGASVEAQLREMGVKVLVHAAWDFSHPKASENWTSNVEGSKRLIEQAQAAGVERIVFVSSISSFDGARSQYGKSKLAVEKLVLAAGGTVIRPGLVWGDRPGGVFGSLRKQVSRGGIVPLVGTGKYVQFLVHEDDLAAIVRQVVLADPGSESAGKVLTIARPEPWPLRDIILRLAKDQGKSIHLVSLPWPLVFAGLKAAETIGMKLGFRSDSLISMVYSNPQPNFSTSLQQLRAFE